MGIFKKKKAKNKEPMSDSANSNMSSLNKATCKKEKEITSDSSISKMVSTKSAEDLGLSESCNFDMNPKYSEEKKCQSQQDYLHTKEGIEPGCHQNASIDMVPQLIDNLATCIETFGDKPSFALRMLFALSEHSSSQHENRILMVRQADEQLVPVLLAFLRRCERSSSEQYLALLVLNNVSIPSENKRLVAIDCGGAQVLSRLLCEDPGCHLIAIIIVNLSFTDSDLRSQLVDPKSSIQLIEALGYVLMISTLSCSEVHSRGQQQLSGDSGGLSPRKLLENFTVKDQQLMSILSDDTRPERSISFLNPNNILHKETARWCLCALKNLTRPSKDPAAARTVLDCGILPLVHKLLFVDSTVLLPRNKFSTAPFKAFGEDNETKMGRKNSYMNFNNDPHTWDPNSLQDAALYVMMNLAATPASRSTLRKENSIYVLSQIAQYSSRSTKATNLTVGEKKEMNFQCLKARMALGYLVGSEGHFGQPMISQTAPRRGDGSDNSALMIMGIEGPLLIELLGNSIHNRGKDGPGGYSGASFNTKNVLFAIRCLLTNNLSVKAFYMTCGIKMNALLVKVIALFSIQNFISIDEETAEYACFSLYLLSNFGFLNPFLPNIYHEALLGKILNCFIKSKNITLAGKHAANQLLLRLPYLNFNGIIEQDDNVCATEMTDFKLSGELLSLADSMAMEMQRPGARPLDDIFGRPILRTKLLKNENIDLPEVSVDAVVCFPSAIDAVQELSFGSRQVQHIESTIDDIKIANNIARSANAEILEAYNYRWSWQDKEYFEKYGSKVKVEKARFEAGKATIRDLITNVRSGKLLNDSASASFFHLNCGKTCNVLNDEYFQRENE